MFEHRISSFEVILLVVGIAAGILGFILINQVYTQTNELNWFAVIAIFSWLNLLVLFILLSIIVDTSKKQYAETKKIIEVLGKRRR